MTAHEIVKGLWIGGKDAQLDEKFLKKYNIRAIVNCTKDIDMPFKNIQYFNVDVHDDLKVTSYRDMIIKLPSAVNFIHQKLDKEHKNVLVACWAGMQRSCCVATAYLSAHRNMTIKDAVTLILQRRPVAFHHGKHINFLDSLMYYAHPQRGVMVR